MKQLQRICAIISIACACTPAFAAMLVDVAQPDSAALSRSPAAAALPANLIIQATDSATQALDKLIAILTHHKENLHALTEQFPLIQMYEDIYIPIDTLQGCPEAIVRLLCERRPEIITEWLLFKVGASNYEAEIARLSRQLKVDAHEIRNYALMCAKYLANAEVTKNRGTINRILREKLRDDGSFIDAAIIKLLLIAGVVPSDSKADAVSLANKFTEQRRFYGAPLNRSNSNEVHRKNIIALFSEGYNIAPVFVARKYIFVSGYRAGLNFEQARNSEWIRIEPERLEERQPASPPTISSSLMINKSDSIDVKKQKLARLLAEHLQNLDQAKNRALSTYSQITGQQRAAFYALTAEFPLIKIYEESYLFIEMLLKLGAPSKANDAESIVNLLYDRRAEIITEWLLYKAKEDTYGTEIAELSNLLAIDPSEIQDYACQCALFLTDNRLDSSDFTDIVRENLADAGSGIQSVIIKLLLIANAVPQRWKGDAIALADDFTRQMNSNISNGTGLRRILGDSDNDDMIVLFPGCESCESLQWQFSSNGLSTHLVDRYKDRFFDIFCHRKYEFVRAHRAGRQPEHKITPELIQRYRASVATSRKNSHSSSPSASSPHSNNVSHTGSSSKTHLTAKFLIGLAAAMLVTKILYEYNLRNKADKSLKTINEILSNSTHLISDVSRLMQESSFSVETEGDSLTTLFERCQLQLLSTELDFIYNQGSDVLKERLLKSCKLHEEFFNVWEQISRILSKPTNAVHQSKKLSLAEIRSTIQSMLSHINLIKQSMEKAALLQAPNQLAA